VIEFAFQVYEEGFAEVERLQKLKADGTTEEKAKAAQQLEQLGVPVFGSGAGLTKSTRALPTRRCSRCLAGLLMRVSFDSMGAAHKYM
jgi:hypothetical protein